MSLQHLFWRIFYDNSVKFGFLYNFASFSSSTIIFYSFLWMIFVQKLNENPVKRMIYSIYWADLSSIGWFWQVFNAICLVQWLNMVEMDNFSLFKIYSWLLDLKNSIKFLENSFKFLEIWWKSLKFSQSPSDSLKFGQNPSNLIKFLILTSRLDQISWYLSLWKLHSDMFGLKNNHILP